MKFSLNLAQYYSNVDLKSFDRDELIGRIGDRIGAIEQVEELAPKYAGVIVVKVVNCEKHSDADKLSVCRIDDDGAAQNVERDQQGLITVVCGAPNVRAGLLVVWIPPGATVPSTYDKEPFVLEARAIRGIVSNGMLGSPRELGVSEEHGGILEIEASDVGEELARPGTAFVKLYGLDDFVVTCENKMFTHRPDCFGNLGIAREVSGIFDQQFKSPDWYVEPISHAVGPNPVAIEAVNQVPELVPRFMCQAVTGLSVQTSPVWLQSYLNRMGVKSINNVVDYSNYFMLLTAQPTHAFDYDKLVKLTGQSKITLGPRLAKKGEKLALLNGKTVELSDKDMVIDACGVPVALAGVMGGQQSEVDSTTKTIVIECATFDMYAVRRTSMRHGLFTDAVTRYTKNQSPLQNPQVLAKFVDELVHSVGGVVASDALDIFDQAKLDSVRKSIMISPDFVNSRLGTELTKEDIAQILANVEFDCTYQDEKVIIKSPFWRTDIELPEDIVEEVGRLYGFSRLPSGLPHRLAKPVGQDAYLKLKTKIRHILARAGANEVLSYSFVHGNLLKKAGQKPEDSFAIRNALSPDLQYYRQTLTPSLLEKVHPNIKAGNDEFAIYELNKTHNKVHGNDEQGLPGELNMLALVFASKNGKSDYAYFEAKKYLEFLAEQLGFTLEFKKAEQVEFPVTKPFGLSRSSYVSIKETGDFLGMVGCFRDEVTTNFKLPASAGFEIGPEVFLEASRKYKGKIYRRLGKYPSTEQDLTLRLPATVVYSELESKIEEALKSTGYAWTLEPVSIFQKEQEPTKNFTFRLTLSHKDRTLTTIEANQLLDDLTLAAQAERV
ncbi:phenylalanine--tRNA ligase subunit beta [Candidatus Saccharibacteria bacterium]|nr:MAG: phenylalanine--tRNA ligase subunit beta [Candidatus Saccharibacteria bacterium]